MFYIASDMLGIILPPYITGWIKENEAYFNYLTLWKYTEIISQQFCISLRVNFHEKTGIKR